MRGPVVGAMAPLAGALAAIVTAGACAPDDPLDGWRAQAVEVCDSAEEDFAAVPGVVDPDQAASAVDVASQISRQRLDALLAIDVPDGSDADVAEFTQLAEESHANLAAMSAALNDGDGEMLEELSVESLVLQEHTHQAASALGVEACAPDAG